MPKSLQEIETDIAALSPAERDILIRDLIASLHDPADDDVEAAWSQEIQRRYREMVDGAVKHVQFDDVIRRARQYLGR